MKKFRKNVISTLSDKEVKEFGINMEEEKENEKKDQAKLEKLEGEYKKALLEQEMKAQGIANPETGKPTSNEEEEDEDETFLESPLGSAVALLGVAAVGVGIFYLMGRK